MKARPKGLSFESDYVGLPGLPAFKGGVYQRCPTFL